MQNTSELTKWKSLIFNNPLFNTVVDLVFNNNFDKKQIPELNSLYKTGMQPNEILMHFMNFSPNNELIKSKPFHYLKLFIQTAEIELLNEENFYKMILEEIIDTDKSTEENKEILNFTKKLFQALSFWAEYTPEILQEQNELKTTSTISFPSNYNVTDLSNFIGVSTKTIYNWDKHGHFIKDKKVNLDKLLTYLKETNLKQYRIFKTKLEEQLV